MHIASSTRGTQWQNAERYALVVRATHTARMERGVLVTRCMRNALRSRRTRGARAASAVGAAAACLAPYASRAAEFLARTCEISEVEGFEKPGSQRKGTKIVTRMVAFANQKGGVGKTATALGLASAIVQRGGQVLLVDADQQGNMTSGLGIELDEGQPTTFDMLRETREGVAAEVVVASPWEGVDIIPADDQLAAIEVDGSSDLVFRMQAAFEGLDTSAYTAVFFDCPPNLGRVLYSVLIAVDGVAAITEPTIDGVRGVGRLDQTIKAVAKRGNPQLVLDKIIVNRRRSTKEHEWREAELRQAYGDAVARTVIPELTARQDAHSEQVPIHKFARGKARTLQWAYLDLLDELPLAEGAMA